MGLTTKMMGFVKNSTHPARAPHRERSEAIQNLSAEADWIASLRSQ
jgi:hypothetical protein